MFYAFLILVVGEVCVQSGTLVALIRPNGFPFASARSLVGIQGRSARRREDMNVLLLRSWSLVRWTAIGRP